MTQFARDWSMRWNRWLLPALGLAVLALLSTFLLWVEYRHALSAAQTSGHNLVSSIETRLDASLMRSDGTLKNVLRLLPEELMQSIAAVQHGKRIDAELDAQLVDFPELLSLRVFDAEGRMLYTSGRDALVGTPHADDLAHFLQLRDNPTRENIFSEVLTSRGTGKPVVVLARAIRGRGGEFLGIASASLSLAYFRDLFRLLDVGRNGVVAIYRSDNSKLVQRWPSLESEINAPLPQDNKLRLAMASGKPEATLDMSDQADGVRRLFCLHRLDRYPFFVLVALSMDDVLEEWRLHARLVAGIELLLLLGALFLQRRLIRSEEGMRESEERFRRLFEDSAEATLIIENNAFIACNRAALAMLGFDSMAQVRQLLPVHLSPELQPDGRRSAEKALEMMALAYRNGNNLFEWEHLRADGRRFTAEVSLTPIYHRDRKLLHVVWRDITERKRMEKAIREEQGKYKTLFDTANDGIFLMDDSGYLDCNQMGASMYGRTVAEVIGHTPLDFSPAKQPNGRPSALVGKEKTMAALRGEPQHFDWLSLRRDGTPFEVEITLSHIELAGKTCMQAIVRDITERKRAEEQLRLAHEAFTNAQEVIIVCDHRACILDVNPAFSEVTGYRREEALGRNPSLLQSGQHAPEFYRDMWQALVRLGRWEGELCNRSKNGQTYLQHTRITAVRDDAGRITRYVAIASDVTQLRENQNRIERMAYYDALTNLPNRSLLADRLKQAIGQADRRQDLLAVCYLDLDGFKPVNDIWGHDAGDRLLIEVAKRLQACVRMGDTVARLGGDEFVVLLGDAKDVHEIEQAVRRILATIAEPFSMGTAEAHLTASIGVTVYPDDGHDPDTLIRHADQAMYTSKQSGKNRHNLFDPESDRRLKAHHEIISRLKDGLDSGELLLYYQPKVDMRQGLVIGAEALIRWQHPQQGLLAPGLFLPMIENTEFSIALGEWVMREALRQMDAWAATGLQLPVSVNISGHHLQQKNFVSRLAAMLAEFPGVKPQWLELEILETTAMDDVEEVSKLISACSALGVSFALDDFGTGYSSLTYFRRLPTNLLKIDQSFVRDMLEDPEDLAIVEGVISLAKTFRRKIIAEGVETIEHGVPLLDIGCDLAQGYAIARPMSADEIPRWIAKWQAPADWSRAKAT